VADATADATELLSIGDLARRSESSPRLLRYYEGQGLLTASRTTSNHRRFPAGAVVTVRSIRLLLDAGVPTRLIRELLDCVRDASRVEPCAVPVLAGHLREHDEKLARLAATRAALQGLIDGSTSSVDAAPADTQVLKGRIDGVEATP
jgi:DNA-binding transcriptional MerR regulator